MLCTESGHLGADVRRCSNESTCRILEECHAKVHLHGDVHLAATAANAHDWYEDKIDPQMKFKCCGGSDCRAVPQSSVQSRIDGGYIYLPHNFNIPQNRVQQSPDGQYHICENTYALTTRCIGVASSPPCQRLSTSPTLKPDRVAHQTTGGDAPDARKGENSLSNTQPLPNVKKPTLGRSCLVASHFHVPFCGVGRPG